MNFQELSKVETDKVYIDLILSASKKAADLVRAKDKSLLVKLKAYKRLETIEKTATKHFNIILKGFPSLDTLPEFYQQLIVHLVNRRKLKHCLAAVNWVLNKIHELVRMHKAKIKTAEKRSDILAIQKAGIGRICSTIKNIKKEFVFLEEARKTMKSFPSIKSKLFTVALAGFPNVGKSTLLSKITTAKPEIADYAFTTKKLNTGYSLLHHHKVQFIDTPGTLNRVNAMNLIELQAHLALRYVTDLIVYVIDLTESYEMKLQLRLLKKMEDYDKTVIIYLSKTDMTESISPSDIASFKEKYSKRYTVCDSLDALKNALIDLGLKKK